MTAPEPFWMLTGPTAVGKTAISLDVARWLDAEIISADSRQLYAGLDAGTAKPDAAALAAVPHHFVDEQPLTEPLSAGRFAEAAHARIRDILARGRRPLIVGGSTLYLYALQFGLADVPQVDADVRAAMARRLETEGAAALYAELQRVDPAAAATMDATKTQRVVRALEVFHGTGRALSAYTQDQPPPPFRYRTVVLYRPREELYRRIDARVDEMLAAGLVDETRRHLAAGIDLSVNPLRTIGYQEAVAHLRGETTHEAMVAQIKRNTRRYAKRQLTWFRRFPSFAWADVRAFSLQ